LMSRDCRQSFEIKGEGGKLMRVIRVPVVFSKKGVQPDDHKAGGDGTREREGGWGDSHGKGSLAGPTVKVLSGCKTETSCLQVSEQWLSRKSENRPEAPVREKLVSHGHPTGCAGRYLLVVQWMQRIFSGKKRRRAVWDRL